MVAAYRTSGIEAHARVCAIATRGAHLLDDGEA
jgi:hypothetical protein